MKNGDFTYQLKLTPQANSKCTSNRDQILDRAPKGPAMVTTSNHELDGNCGNEKSYGPLFEHTFSLADKPNGMDFVDCVQFNKTDFIETTEAGTEQQRGDSKAQNGIATRALLARLSRIPSAQITIQIRLLLKLKI